MKLAVLIQKGGLREVATATVATVATDMALSAGSVATVARVAVAEGHGAANDSADSLPDPRAEARRQRVLAMLEAHPGTRYALVTDTETDPQAAILTLAIRGQATCELRIPRDRYDPFLLLDLIERHGDTVH